MWRAPTGHGGDARALRRRDHRGGSGTQRDRRRRHRYRHRGRPPRATARRPPTRALRDPRPATRWPTRATPMVPLTRSRGSARARRRPRSATRTPSWRRRSPSTSPTARSSAMRPRRSRRPRPTSACRPTSAARSRARRSPRSNRRASSHAHPRRHRRRSTSCWASCTKAVHPITVLSTLPSAGIGAVFALLMFRMDFSIIALIGVFLLIGIVKKNAILIIDFALEAERTRGLIGGRGGARGVPAALPADPDDDAGRRARRVAAGDRLRRGRGAAPAARRRHHRRADRQPGADAADDAGRLRPARQAAPQAEAARPRGAAPGGGWLPEPMPRSPAGPCRTASLARSWRARRRACVSLAGCAVGPDYTRPAAPDSTVYKEAPTGGATWLRATPPMRSTAAPGGSCSTSRT